MPKSRAVGIDLGTTYSVAAWVDSDTHTTIIPNSEGEVLTPSVVLFEDHETIVGKEAKRANALRVDRVAEFVKRDMGSPVYSRPIRGQFFPPEVIQAFILRKLKEGILKTVGPDYQTVITVPAFFDEPRRRATAQAGEIAGLNLLDIVNEPTAAALAFGEELGYLNEKGTRREQMNLLVYDLGGGTFDVTLVELQSGSVRTLATDGDVQLGGRDWDLRLANYVSEAFVKQHREDPRNNPASLQRLLTDVEDAKHTLSLRNKTKIRIEHTGSVSEVPVTREIFEQVTLDLLERTSSTTRQVLSTAGLAWNDIGRILLVGGSTRMPMIERMLKDMSGITPDHTVHPDEAVARGAALFAHYRLESQGESHSSGTFQITDVNAHSLGIEGVDPETLRKRNKILIPRNTPLPARVVKDFVTKTTGQSSIVIQVLEGESAVPADCAAIGRTVIRDLPPDLPQGSPVDVTYEYGTNGRLQVKAKVRGIGREATLELERDSELSEQRVKQWKRILNSSVEAGGRMSGNTCGIDGFESLIADTVQEIRENKAKREAAANLPPGAAPVPINKSATEVPSSSDRSPNSKPIANELTKSAPDVASPLGRPSDGSAAPPGGADLGPMAFEDDFDEILEQGMPPSTTPRAISEVPPGPTSSTTSPLTNAPVGAQSIPQQPIPQQMGPHYMPMPYPPGGFGIQYPAPPGAVYGYPPVPGYGYPPGAGFGYPQGPSRMDTGNPVPGPVDVESTESSNQSRSGRRPGSLLRVIVFVLAMLFSSVFGLACGYYVLCCIYPREYNLWNLPIPEMFQPVIDEES